VKISPAKAMSAVIDPVTLPWTVRPATGSPAWAIVGTCAGDMIARVRADYAELFRSLPDLLEKCDGAAVKEGSSDAASAGS
jgi:hypothetical protein